tara:strand:+ start:535 stop:693 length:159 start_codon:yes stop_codon:yes gene_type:complete
MTEDQLMSQLEDRFLDEDDESESIELFDDWEEIETPTPCNFKGQHYHRSFSF